MCGGRTGDGKIPEQLVCVGPVQEVVDKVHIVELAADDGRGVLVGKVLQRPAEFQRLRVRRLVRIGCGRVDRNVRRDTRRHCGGISAKRRAGMSLGVDGYRKLQTWLSSSKQLSSLTFPKDKRRLVIPHDSRVDDMAMKVYLFATCGLHCWKVRLLPITQSRIAHSQPPHSQSALTHRPHFHERRRRTHCSTVATSYD